MAGIEIDERLAGIAKNNFRVLGVADRVCCMEADAAEFDGYGGYNVFFMCNPFSGPIVEKVADRLLEVSRNTDIIIIYYNPVYMDLFRQKGKIEVIKQLYDKMKDYNTCIFSMRAE